MELVPFWTGTVHWAGIVIIPSILRIVRLAILNHRLADAARRWPDTASPPRPHSGAGRQAGRKPGARLLRTNGVNIAAQVLRSMGLASAIGLAFALLLGLVGLVVVRRVLAAPVQSDAPDFAPTEVEPDSLTDQRQDLPPILAEKLILLFAPRSKGQPLIGDLWEEFARFVLRSTAAGSPGCGTGSRLSGPCGRCCGGAWPGSWPPAGWWRTSSAGCGAADPHAQSARRYFAQKPAWGPRLVRKSWAGRGIHQA
jgi:hypothetical protein